MEQTEVLQAIHSDPPKKLNILFTDSYNKLAIQVIHFRKWITYNQKALSTFIERALAFNVEWLLKQHLARRGYAF